MILYSQGTGVIHTHFSSAPSVVHTVYRLPTESQRLRQLEGFYGVRIEWNEAVKCLGTFHHKGTGETFGRRGLLLCHLDSRNEKKVYFWQGYPHNTYGKRQESESSHLSAAGGWLGKRP